MSYNLLNVFFTLVVIKCQRQTERSHYIYQKDIIKIRPESPGVRVKDWIPNFAIIGNCGIGKVQVRHTWRHLAGR